MPHNGSLLKRYYKMKKLLLAAFCLVFYSTGFSQLFYDHYNNGVVNFVSGAGTYAFSEANSIWTITATNKTGYQNFTYRINDELATKTIDVSQQSNRYIVIRARAINEPEELRIDFRGTNDATTAATNNNGPIVRTIQTGAFQEYTYNEYYSNWDPYANKALDWTQVNALDFYFDQGNTSSNTIEIDWIYVGPPTNPPVVNLGNDIDQCGLDYTIDAGNPGASFKWFKDNVEIPNETSRFLTVTESAAYTVEVTNLFNTSSDVINVNLRPTPTADFTLNEYGPVNTSIAITNTSTGGGTYEWDISNNNSVDYTSTNISHTFTAAGIYDIKLTADNGQCSSEIIKTIDIGTPPTVDLGPNITTCDPAVTLNAGNIGAKYSWSPINWNLRTLSTSTSGTYSVTVTNNYGSDTDDIVVTFKDNTVAGFVGPTLAEQNQSVSFTDVSSGTIDTWTWDFGDGIGGSSDQNPTYAFPNAGTYTVSLTIDNGTCSDTYTFPILITAPCTPPTVDLGSDVNQCGGTTTLDAGVQDPNSTILWSTGESTQTITVSQSGFYSVQVSNACGQAQDFKNVFINAIPVASATIPTSGNINQSIQFNDNSTNATTWEWDFGDLTPVSVQKNPTHTYTSTGTFTVTLTAKNGNCTDQTSGSITINSGGTTGTPPSVELGSNIIQCEGSATLDAGTQPTGTTYLWSTGETSQTITVSSSGIYEVTVRNDYGVDNDFITVRIDQTPDATIFANATAEVNEPVAFANNSFVGNSWNWNFGDGSSNKTVQSPIHKFSAQGTFTVTLTIVNGLCSDNKTHEISIVQGNGGNNNNCTGSAPVVDLGPDVSQCEGTFTIDGGTYTDNPKYFWSTGSGDPSITVGASNVYTLTVINDCGSDSDDILVIISGTPNADLSLPDSAEVDAIVPFKDKTPEAVAIWDWDFGDAVGTSDKKNPFYTYTSTGTFTVSLTVENDFGCTSSASKDIKIYKVLGIEEDLLKNSLVIYPNPSASSTVHIQYDAATPTVIEVYDLAGNLIESQEQDRGYITTTLDNAFYSPGLYIVNITGEGININEKLIIY